MDKNGVLGEVLEKGQSVVQKTGKAVADSASGAVKVAVGQAAGDSNQPGTNEANTAVSDQQQIASDKAQNDEFVKELYAPSAPQNAQSPSPIEQQSRTEEQIKLANVRQKLHDEVYYQPLIQGSKSREERPAEKVEREKKQEMQDLQKKEAVKPAPIAVQRAQQTAEKFRGVSG
jgi:hypothetical protein